ncbi:coordinator of PRMT5 and differentiation stimulator [Lacerta agilis]|uniref:coordinator of PRMT5 and differentiation stimulator n=1 Tax=Lacerta agilis TaxID=80427 RepID=UPI0014195432|nr:coordinator of PRMT5 and differentiation stimulator [Lacerta agilis]
MEAAGQREPLGRFLLPEQRKKADASAFAEQEEFEVVKTFSWRHGKGLAEHAMEKAKSALEEWEDFESPYEDSESDGEDLSVPTDTAFIETKTVSHYVEEDWDKELEENENNSNPYDFEDVIHCGGFLDQEPVACSVQEKPLYDPSLHHVAPVIWRQVETMPVEGQFDDAVD